MEIETPPETHTLSLAWLGTPLVHYASRPLAFQTRKATALLVYLTVEGGIHSREKLTTLFWPESDTHRGRGMLRTTLAHLREPLRPVDTIYLRIETQALGFAFDHPLDFDLQHVQVALNAIQSQPGPTARQQSVSVLQRALRDHRGEFLEGFSLADAPDFDDWVRGQRELWHSRLDLLYDTLSQWQFEAGDLPAALETAMRWKAHNLFGESAPLRLMQLHFANSNRAAALEVYDGYRKILAAEFGARPSEQMRALAARIRTTSPATPSVGAAISNPPERDLPFVGRAEEFARLQASYTAASHGQPKVVLLTGEAGIGKTRLAREFLNWARAQGADVLNGRAFETGGEVPYQPVAHFLRQRLEHETEISNLLSTTWLAELSRLLPEVRERFPDLPQPQSDEATAQHRLLEAITLLGMALAERSPLVIFIDDIQWADLPSLDALHYVMARWTERKTPILLLLGSREIVPSEKNNLRQWLTSLKAKLTVMEMMLAPLTVDDTLTLLTSLLTSLQLAKPGDRAIAPTRRDRETSGNVPSGRAATVPKFDAFAQALFDETGGQPLYLVESVKALLEQKTLIPYQSDEDAQTLRWSTLAGETTGQFPLPRIIPHSVREAILERVSRLTPVAVSLLTAAAVLGQATTFRQLADTAGMDQMAGLDGMEELVAKRLLVDSESAGEHYVIAHDKIREVIYRECSTVRKRVLHSRAFAALQGGNPAQLAYHALMAGMEIEAFKHSVVAGNAALQLFAASEAIAHFESARKLLGTRSLPSVELDTVEQLYMGLGRALELNAQRKSAGDVYAELHTFAVQRDAPALRLVALTAQANLRCRVSVSFNPTEGEAFAQDALQLARTLGNRAAEAGILGHLVDYYRLSNRLPEAIHCGEQALNLARELNLRDQTALILDSLVKCYAFSGRLDLAEQAQQQACDLWRDANNLVQLAESLADLAFLTRWSGDYDRSLAFSDEAYRISHSIANVWVQSFSRITTGYIYWERGEPDQAIATMAECIRLSEAANYLTPQILTRADLGALYTSLGDSRRGIALVKQALELANSQLPLYRPYVIGLMARLYVRQNRFCEATALIEQARRQSDHLFFSFLVQWVRLAEAELAVRQGEPARALAVAETILQAIVQSGMRSMASAVLFVKAQSLADLGDKVASQEALAQAHSEAERLRSRRMLTQIITLQANLEDDPLKAAHLHRKAEEIGEYISRHTPAELRTSFQTFLKV